jgi:UDP-N-acetylglucosamine 2-epimerase (non-hydrolysing)
MVGPLPLTPPRRWLPRRQFKLLVTCHRRENWAAGLEGLATALLELIEHKLAADIILPPNPGVSERMHRLLGGKRGISLIPPLSHAATIAAMRAADVVLSDSGGMQEEAPALGVPLLILRDKTERPEGLVMGTMELVGTDPDRIVAAVERLRRDRRLLREMAQPSLPFGDGRSAPRIAELCLAYADEMAAARRSCRA